MREFNEGDLVEAVKGETRMTARLKCDGYLGFPGWYGVDDLFRFGWVLTLIEKAAPPLPTEPGLYLAGQIGGAPRVFELTDTSGWWLLNTGSMFPVGDGHLERFAPFTRLEPVPVTVRKVLEAVGEYLDGQLAGRTKDEILRHIATEFGVPNE